MMDYSDIAKTFELLLDQMTGKHEENPGLTGLPKGLLDLIFFALDSP